MNDLDLRTITRQAEDDPRAADRLEVELARNGTTALSPLRIKLLNELTQAVQHRVTKRLRSLEQQAKDAAAKMEKRAFRLGSCNRFNEPVTMNEALWLQQKYEYTGVAYSVIDAHKSLSTVWTSDGISSGRDLYFASIVLMTEEEHDAGRSSLVEFWQNQDAALLGHQQVMRERFPVIPVTDILYVSVRSSIDNPSLTEDIAKHGLLRRPTVTKFEGVRSERPRQFYRMVSGHCRLFSWRSLGHSTIPVEVV